MFTDHSMSLGALWGVFVRLWPFMCDGLLVCDSYLMIIAFFLLFTGSPPSPPYTQTTAPAFHPLQLLSNCQEIDTQSITQLHLVCEGEGRWMRWTELLQRKAQLLDSHFLSGFYFTLSRKRSWVHMQILYVLIIMSQCGQASSLAD